MKLDLSKIEVEEFLNELGMMKIKRDGNEVTFSCPFGLHKKGGAISMRSDTTQFSCFGCGAKGNALTFLEELEDLQTKDAIRWLGERWDISRQIDTNNFKGIIAKRLERSERKRTEVITPYNYDIPIIDNMELEEREVDWDYVKNEMQGNVISYLLDRGFNSQTLIDWHIGWDSISKTFSIPYHDEYGNLVGFKGRSLPSGDPRMKYIALGNKEGKENRYNFNTCDISNVLFGLHKAENKEGIIIVCEGELNCISMHQDGFTNTVGISGQYLSERQINLIKKHTNKVILIFDEWDRQVKIAEQLKKFISVMVVREHDKDPAEMNLEEKIELILNGVSGILIK